MQAHVGNGEYGLPRLAEVGTYVFVLVFLCGLFRGLAKHLVAVSFFVGHYKPKTVGEFV